MSNPIGNTYLSKIIISVFVAIAVVNSYASVIYFRLSIIPGFAFNNTIFKYLHPLLVISAVFFIIIYPIYWHKRKLDSEKISACFSLL